MGVETYSEMNSKIKEILRIGDNPECLYAARRIEELEKENEQLREDLTKERIKAINLEQEILREKY